VGRKKATANTNRNVRYYSNTCDENHSHPSHSARKHELRYDEERIILINQIIVKPSSLLFAALFGLELEDPVDSLFSAEDSLPSLLTFLEDFGREEPAKVR
jgi:hypothetical protein